MALEKNVPVSGRWTKWGVHVRSCLLVVLVLVLFKTWSFLCCYNEETLRLLRNIELDTEMHEFLPESDYSKVLGYASLVLDIYVEGLNVINDPKCNKLLSCKLQ